MLPAVRSSGRTCGLADNPGFFHFVPQVVTFARTFAYAGEYGVAAVLGGNVVDQFHNQNRLADACAAEQTDLTAFYVRSDQVDDLDAVSGYPSKATDLQMPALPDESASDPPLLRLCIVVHRFAKGIKNTSQRPVTGTEIGAPVSIAFVPRIRPSVELMATQRTTPSPKCCITSAVSPDRYLAAFIFDMNGVHGRQLLVLWKAASTLAPMTCVTFSSC